MSERRAGAADTIARKREVDGDDDDDQGGASFPLPPRGRV